MATTVSSCAATSMWPRTRESETDSISNVMARIASTDLAKQGRDFLNRNNPFRAHIKSFQTNSLTCHFVRAIGEEERNISFHRVFYLVAERPVGKVHKD